MDALIFGIPERSATPAPDRDSRIRAFRATDAFATDALRAAAGLGKEEWRDVARAIREAAIRSGGALVAACCATPGGEEEKRLVDRAREALAEARYYLLLARRLGALDLRRYRTLAAHQDAAMREVGALTSSGGPTARGGS